VKSFASLEVGQTPEVLERLKKEGIPAHIRTLTHESGLEFSEIIVDDGFYGRGCDVVERWYSEQLAAAKKGSGVYCRNCGSRNYDRAWNERIGYIYKCKDCGYDFAT
jgi:predicted RNA-binding Zn-ribbon protein involved in translation (DUF1610 family)